MVFKPPKPRLQSAVIFFRFWMFVEFINLERNSFKVKMVWKWDLSRNIYEDVQYLTPDLDGKMPSNLT